MSRIVAQLAFLNAADALKGIDRANVLMDGTRPENTAEHSWHLALYAMVMAEYAPAGTDPDRALAMGLLHDLVEIDAGDHPIHLPCDAAAVALAERDAATRLYGLLPTAQGTAFRAIWEEFETQSTPTARFVRMLDMTQPLFQSLGHVAPTQTDRDIMRDILRTGRCAELADTWPAVHAHATGILEGRPAPLPSRLAAQVRFLAEADRLKSVLRGTPIHDGSRRENSAEHAWHVAVFAMTLAEHAVRPVDPGTVMRMMILHDLVEIDAGDRPIHSRAARDTAAQDAAEARAADRLYNLLPPDQAVAFRALWDTFEAAETPDAVFAKSIDRLQPVLSNLATGGGSWREYAVTRDQLEARVGEKVRRGTNGLWDAIAPELDAWFGA